MRVKKKKSLLISYLLLFHRGVKVVFTKAGCIIGLVLGAAMFFFAVMGKVSGEAGAQDSFIFIFIILGALMVIGNIIQLTKLTKKPASVQQPESKAFGKNAWILVLGIILVLSAMAPVMQIINDPWLYRQPGLRTGAGIFFIIGFFILYFMDRKEEREQGYQAVAAKPLPKEKVQTPSQPETENKVRCRFCKKLYSSEYNGCPYCKKK